MTRASILTLKTSEHFGCSIGMLPVGSMTPYLLGSSCSTIGHIPNSPVTKHSRPFERSRRLNGRHSEVTLRQHLDVFIQTYVSRRALTGPLEESLDCPLVELDLLQAVGMRRVDRSGRQEPVYAFRREAKPEITTGLFEYCLLDYWQTHHPNEETLTYQDVAIAPRSIGQVFKLPEDDIRSRLDVYSAPDSGRPITYRPSAVQGIITCNYVEHRNFLSAVYAKEDFVD